MTSRIRLALLAAALACCQAADEGDTFSFGTKFERAYLPDDTSLVATRVDHAPKLDGTLDDPLWQKASRTRSAFTTLGTTEPTGRQTAVYACHDERALYLAFDCEEKEIEQQDVDGHDIIGADHVGALIEVGDTQGRGARCGLIGNRAGVQLTGAWREQKVEYVCKAGPNRWFAEIGIPFASLGTAAPQTGERWGVKFTRYGKNTGTGAQRMRACWPHIPTISEDVLAYNGTLCFGSDDMLANRALKAGAAGVDGWQVAAGTVAAAGDGIAAKDATLRQAIALHAGRRYALEWKPGAVGGAVAVTAGGKELARAPLDAPTHRLAWSVKAGDALDAAIDLRLQGSGAPPVLSLTAVIDDVPENWICLTNNDWVPERDLKNRVPAAPEGVYTWLKTPMLDQNRTFYRSNGCPDPSAKDLPYEWMITGRPSRPPVDQQPARPDIGPEEMENTPFEVIYTDSAVPEFVGLPSGAFDVGGVTGSIPFSKGSVTGDPSWAGWPVNRWSGQAAHDLLLDFKDKYFIRRIDIQQINTGVRNLDLLVRGAADPAQQFTPIYRFNGPGTAVPLGGWLPAYFSLSGLDSVAQQLRLSMGINRGDGEMVAVASPPLGRPNCQVGLYGLCEVWVWAEPKAAHADDEVKVLKPFLAEEKPPLVFDQLRKLPEPVLWPRPKQFERQDGRFDIGADTPIAAYGGGSVPDLARRLRATLADRMDVEPPALDGAAVAADARAIRLGVVGSDAGFDAVCAKLGLKPDAERPEGYAIGVTPGSVVVAGADLPGLRDGVQTLTQWLDHDEQRAFLRCARIVDWPSVRMRTVVPSSDHRQPFMPVGTTEKNYVQIIDALADLRINAVVDWLPTEPGIPDERARELVHYATARSIEVRPALWVRDVPGDCIEVNPDQQPAGRGGIANSDGTYESDNLCPSNPETYRAIERFLDRALVTHDDCRFVDVGFMGSLGRTWNACATCRARGQDGAALYAQFINRIDRICRARGRLPIFTNAIMFSEAVRLSAQGDAARALDQLNAGITMRLDRATTAADIIKSRLWGVSKPWSTPPALSNTPGAYGWPGTGFFDTAQLRPDMEAVIVVGEKCDYEWRWRRDLSTSVLWAADRFWNADSGAAIKPADYVQVAANACVRLNERVSTGCEYPSWRTGMAPKFFSVDIRAACNRSHIDDGSASGPGRSGPKEGVNGFGAAYDFRRVPLGASRFADIPFEVIDPAKNGWKSMVVVGRAPREGLVPGAVPSAEIPIGRKAASLCVLHTVLRTVMRTGQLEHYWNLLLPAYVFEYADGTRCVCDRETRRHFDDVQHQMFFYGSALGPDVGSYLLPAARLGYATNTLSGKGATLFVNEFVNPYPDKEIASLAIQLPNPEERDWSLEFHDAIVAVTGVEPTAWDNAWWSRHVGDPLLPANATVPADSRPIEVKFTESGDGPRRIWRGAIEPAAPLTAVGFRLRNAWRDSCPMAVRVRHADVTVSVTEDGSTWKPVATMKGCCGMDGDHVVALPAVAAKGVMVTLDPSAYPDEDPKTDFGVHAIAVFRGP